MIRLLFACLTGVTLLAAGQSASAQIISHRPNGVPLYQQQNAHSYELVNHSGHVIVSAEARMTNGDVRDLTWGKPVLPRKGRNVAVPAKECLAVVTVRFDDGRAMRSGAPNCRQTRITVTDHAISIGNNGTPANRPG